MKHVVHHPLLDDHPKPGGGFPLLILRRHGFGLARQSMLVQQYQGRKQDREYREIGEVKVALGRALKSEDLSVILFCSRALRT